MEAEENRERAPLRCLVTGATGMIGSCLVKQLVGRGYRVAALLRPSSSPWRIAEVLGQLKVIRGDLADLAEAAPAIRSFAPHAVFHLGWYGVSARNHYELPQITVNLWGTLALVRLACETGCKGFIGLGSQAEYGAYDGILNEELVPQPATLYGATKLCAALLTQKFCRGAGMRFVWLRLLSVFGPGDDPDHMLPTVIHALLRGVKPKLTAGTQKWDYLYVDDAAEAIRLAAEQAVEGIFNLASGQPTTLRAAVEIVRDLIDPRLPLGWGELPAEKQAVRNLLADISRFQKATGWAPRVPLAEGLRRTVAWYCESQGRTPESLPATSCLSVQ